MVSFVIFTLQICSYLHLVNIGLSCAHASLQKGEIQPVLPQDEGNIKPSTTRLAIKSPVKSAFRYCRSPSTREQYPRMLKMFFDFIRLPGKDVEEQGQNFLDKARHDPGWANDMIMDYLDHLRERVEDKKEITAGTLQTFIRPIKTFMIEYDDVANKINWRRISKAMPRAKGYSNDRIPTLEELRKLVEYPDRRIKALVYTFCSSGIRRGEWEDLKWKHVTPMTNDKGEVVAAKLIVYAEDRDQYITFCSPEAYKAMKDWMDFRERYGEPVTGESPVMRNLFAVADLKRGGGGSKRGGKYGKIVDADTITIRTPLEKNKHEIQRIVLDKASWILQKQREFRKNIPQLIKPTFKENSTLPYLGKNYPLIIKSKKQSENELQLINGEFVATINSSKNSKILIKNLYESWLSDNAQITLREKVEKCSQKTGIEVERVNIKNLRRRWGSLTKDKKTINLNVNLLKAPDDVIDYIILHELCHVKINDHSHHYWDLVRKYMASYQEKIDWLNANTSILV